VRLSTARRIRVARLLRLLRNALTVNKFERVRAALRGERVDRIPFSFYFHFPESQRAGKAMAEAHLEHYRATDPDFLKVMNDNYYSPPDFKGLTTPSDWRGLKPAPLSAQCFQDQLSGLRRIVSVVGKEVPIITTVFNPFENGDGMSDWKATEQLKEYPEAVSEGLATVAASLEEFVRACVEAGADGIYFAAHGGGRSRHTAAEFDKFIRPHDLTVLRAARNAGAGFNLLHICGKDLRLEAYEDYPAEAVNWAPQSGNLSLTEGRRLFKRTVVGGVDQAGPMVTGTREQVVAEIRKAVDEIGGKGFMLGAGCALAKSVRAERVGWARETLELSSRAIRSRRGFEDYSI
jgi:uroporphyrinogen decarboxylase